MWWDRPMVTSICIAQDPAADELLGSAPLALVIGMLLDQQIGMEIAFRGPAKLKERLGHLDAARIASMDADEFGTVMATPPAVHRFPGSMGARVQALCAVIAQEYANDASRLWAEVGTGKELLARMKSLPGFGDQKARIFVALLGKQLDVTPSGWREAAGAYGEDGATRSVADVRDQSSLLAVRSFKQQAKRAAKAAT
jgi:uncharacterized HhH-GPD family protein